MITVPVGVALLRMVFSPDPVGTRWSGTAELWLDPSGDEARRSDCTITLTADGLEYTWAFEGVGLRLTSR